jgi:hypothetical protein
MTSHTAAGAAPAPSPFVPISRGYRALVLGAAAVALTGVLLLALATGGRSSAFVIGTVVVHVVVLLFPVIFYRASFGWFHPVVFTSLLALAGLLRKVPTYVWGVSTHTALPTHTPAQLTDLLAYQLWLVTLGTLAYYAAFFFLPAPRAPTLHFPTLRAKPTRVKVALAVAFSLGAFMLYTSQQGGLISHLLSWGQGRRVALAGEYYWVPLISMGALACLIWVAREPKIVRNPAFIACFLVALPPVFLTTGSRSTLLNLFAAGMMAWMIRRRRVPLVRLGMAAVAGLILLTVLGEFRRSMVRGQVDWSILTDVDPTKAFRQVTEGELARRASSESAVLPILARVPDEVDLIYGRSYVALLTLPVPRSVWPKKPMLVYAEVGKVFFGVPWGMPPGAVGEAYWNFHLPGVIIVFLLFGVFHRWLARVVRRYPDEPAVLLCYTTLLIFFNSPSSPSVVSASMVLVPIVGMLWLFGGIRFGGRAARRPRLGAPAWRPRPAALEGP